MGHTRAGSGATDHPIGGRAVSQVLSGDLGRQGVTANSAVARAQLVRLQGVEDAQRVFRVAADIQIGRVDVLDRAFIIDDVGVAIGHAFRGADTEAVDQGTGRVGKLPVTQLVQVRVLAAPGQLAEFIVRGTGQHDGVTVGELFSQIVEGHDLGRADEGEILRVEDDDLPLAREAFIRQRFEGAFAIFFVSVEARLHTGDFEFGKLVANTQH